MRAAHACEPHKFNHSISLSSMSQCVENLTRTVENRRHRPTEGQDTTMSKTPMVDMDLVLPKHEAGRQLGVSTRQIDRFIHDGELPVVELSPRRVGVLQSDLDRFKLSRRRVRVPADAPAQDQAAA